MSAKIQQNFTILWRITAKFACVICLFALSVDHLSRPVFALEKSAEEEELKALKAKIQSVQEALSADKTDQSEHERKLEALEKDIAGLNQSLKETSENILRTEDEIKSLSEKVKDFEQQLGQHNERVARLSYVTYVSGRQSQLKLYLNQENPNILSRMLGYQHYIVAARAESVRQINTWVEELHELSERLQSKSESLRNLKNTQNAQRQQLENKRIERTAALEKIKSRIDAKEAELSQLKNNEQQLQAVIKQLQEHMANAKFKAVDKGSFGKMKGNLSLPVSAPIITRFGQRRASGVSWDGIQLSAENGSNVRAIYQGRVVYADWLKGFGLLLILDHGDGYMSLYSHNEILLINLGSWVESGEVISTVGTSGGLDAPTLYFEIRHYGKPLNPLAWVSTK